ncbi:MAG: hypothetical protein IPO12_15460 [Flavobacteriales bacterium]|nr:hypothetical protein [Flavobacteriales bacterium]
MQDIGAELGFSVVDDPMARRSCCDLGVESCSAIQGRTGSSSARISGAGGGADGARERRERYLPPHHRQRGQYGTWDFYAELIGASVQENPNHVSGTPLYAMHHIGTHASPPICRTPG